MKTRKPYTRWTIEECTEYALDFGYKIISEKYYSNSEKLEIVHLECGYDFFMTWADFANSGTRCPKCFGHIRLTLEYCKLESLKRGYRILEKSYKNATTKMKFMHLQCGYKYSQTWDNFLNNDCPKCGGRLPVTLKEIKKYAKSRGYRAVGEELKKKTEKIKLEHTICGNIFFMNWEYFHNRKQGCPKCYGSNKPTISFCKKYSKSRGYVFLSTQYINGDSLYDFLHKECGREFKISWRSFYNNECGCSYCSKFIQGKKKSKSSAIKNNFKDNFPEIYNEVDFEKTKIDLENVSAGGRYRIWWKCSKCNGSWESYIYSRTNKKRNSGCPFCNKSKGENFIKSFLIKNNIKFQREKRFDDCYYKKKLPFDFYLKKENTIIEYDGEAHFMPVQFGGIKMDKAEKNFEEAKNRDVIKNLYCVTKNIKLIRIPYWEFENIEKILRKELNIQ